MSGKIENRKSAIENPKNIILRNPAFPGQTRRARKNELKWFAERGWKPEVIQNKEAASSVRQ